MLRPPFKTPVLVVSSLFLVAMTASATFGFFADGKPVVGVAFGVIAAVITVGTVHMVRRGPVDRGVMPSRSEVMRSAIGFVVLGLAGIVISVGVDEAIARVGMGFAGAAFLAIGATGLFLALSRKLPDEGTTINASS